MRVTEVPEDSERELVNANQCPYHLTPGLACLHIATLQRNQPLIELLLQNGADIDAQVRQPIRTLPAHGLLPTWPSLPPARSPAPHGKWYHCSPPDPRPSPLPLRGLG